MKVTNQTIPPSLQDEYDRLFARKPTGAGDAFITRTKPKVRKPAPKKTPRKILKDYEEATDFLIEYLTKINGIPPEKTFRAAQIAELKKGYFNPEYWKQCTEESSATLENNPTSGPFIEIRNYAYPDPGNQPSTPTYGAGVPASGNPAYIGWTTNTVFNDMGLRWIRKVFSLNNGFTFGEQEPLFLKLTGTVTASANMRPSRAMISAVIKRWMVAAGSPRETTTEAPVNEPIAAYWRYRMPSGEAPYFNLTKPLQLMYSMRSKKYEEPTGDLTKAVILIAPMPMMGKRFNNNTTISSTIDATSELWQIKKALKTIVGSAQTAAGEWHACRWTSAGIEDLQTIAGISSAASIATPDGKYIIGSVKIAELTDHAFVWTNGVMTDLGVLYGNYSGAVAISSNGSVIAGNAFTQQGYGVAVKWENGGITNLGTLGGLTSAAYAMTSDGSIIAGAATYLDQTIKACIWKSGSIIELPSLSQWDSYASGISADGTVIFGGSKNALQDDRAVKWVNGQIIDLGSIGAPVTSVVAMSDDKTVFVGKAQRYDPRQFACSWTPAGFFDLIPLTVMASIARGVSENGSVIVGTLRDGSLEKTWRWTAETGAVDIGTLGHPNAYSASISKNGALIVGTSYDTLGQSRAFKWSALGMEDLGTLGGNSSKAATMNW